jgi:hypothetical protein
MSANGFRVYVPDPSHGAGDVSDDAMTGPSAEFRHELEAEYGLKFRFTSIGTGAAVASYCTELASGNYDKILVAVSIFLAGKAIKEGFEAWSWMYTKLASFFHRSPTFDREGAAVLAYQAVVNELGGLPKSYQLEGFQVQDRLSYPNPMDVPDLGHLTEIHPAPDRVTRSSIYVFQIIVDGRNFRAAVDGTKVNIVED